jgi:hypothetical protein
MNIKIVTFIVIMVIGFINYSFAQNNTSQSIKINEGSGSFQINGGIGHEDDLITIHYHKPKNMTSKSKMLIVIPGSGRNGDDYRDSWIETSEKHSVFILSPSYAEKDYSYGDYHLGGIVKDVDLSKGITFKENSNQVLMDEDLVKFEPNNDSNEWIYNDFDRIFEMAKEVTQSKQQQYDMFGHSAGGQVLHRFALIYPNSKADRILASNAASYTVADVETGFPFGLKNTDINSKILKKAFKKNLVIFLGELDNADEDGGLLLRSKTVDKQGTHRLARGTYFYNKGLETARSLNTKINWKLEIIAGVGHNQRKMAKAAAIYLYEN